MGLSDIKVAFIVTKRTFQWLLREAVTFTCIILVGNFHFMEVTVGIVNIKSTSKNTCILEYLKVCDLPTPSCST